MTTNSNKLDLYNVKILQIYFNYLKNVLKIDDVKIKELFTNSGTNISILNSENNWFSQEISDSFYSNLIKLTSDNEIAFKVGEFTVRQATSTLAVTIIKAARLPHLAFSRLGNTASLYSKGAKLTPLKIGLKQAKIRSTIINGCTEKPYQCLNRMGMLKAMPELFSCKNTKITHPSCFHRGDQFCEYEISWSNPWQKYRSQLALAVFIFSQYILKKYFMSSISQALNFKFINTLLLSTNLSLISYILVSKSLTKKFETYADEQNRSLEESYKILEKRHNETNLILDIIKSTTKILPLISLCDNIVSLIVTKMNYNRSGIFLVTPEKTHLEAVAAEGYSQELRNFIIGTKFNINISNNTGILVKVVNSGKSIYLRNVNKQKSELSQRSRDFLEKVNTKSLIAVPIKFGEVVLGIITVDNDKDEDILNTHDQLLLEGLADHIATTISNIKSYEELNFLKINLERQVAEKSKENEEKSTALFQSTKLASIGTFATGMTHEILSAINVIVGSLPLIDRYMLELEETESKKKIQKHVKKIAFATNHAVDICNHLRVYTGKDKVLFSAIKLKDVFDGARTILSGKIIDSRVRITYNIEDDAEISGNKTGLQEIVINLISNAIDALPPNGQIHVEATTYDSTHVKISVTDNGPGIPTEVQQKIFDPFFTTKKVGAGTGLGLSIVEGEVKKHRGSIKLDTEFKEGARFIVILPKQGAPKN